jgi:hypothetical protein
MGLTNPTNHPELIRRTFDVFWVANYRRAKLAEQG